MEVGSTLATQLLPENDAKIVAIIAYCETLSTLAASSPIAKAERLLIDWRYCVFRNTYLKAEGMLEIGLAPLTTKEALDFFHGLMGVLRMKEVAAVQCHDIAPKNSLERKIEMTLLMMMKKRNSGD